MRFFYLITKNGEMSILLEETMGYQPVLLLFSSRGKAKRYAQANGLRGKPVEVAASDVRALFLASPHRLRGAFVDRPPHGGMTTFLPAEGVYS